MKIVGSATTINVWVPINICMCVHPLQKMVATQCLPFFLQLGPGIVIKNTAQVVNFFLCRVFHYVLAWIACLAHG